MRKSALLIRPPFLNASHLTPKAEIRYTAYDNMNSCVGQILRKFIWNMSSQLKSFIVHNSSIINIKEK